MSWSRRDRWPMLALALGVAVLLAERVAPLRAPTRPLSARLPSNLAHGALAAVTHALTTAPVDAALVGRYPVGLARLVPPAARTLVTIALLDLTFWMWHLANHQARALWMFHIAHHRDPDLDTTTAIRFHPGEIALGALFRAAQILVVGPSEADLARYDALFRAAVLFHHSNATIPGDRALSALIVTPRLHGIHHDLALGHANLGVLLSLWDRLFGSYVRDVPQAVLHIGALPLVATRHTPPPPAVRIRPPRPLPARVP